MAKDKADIEIPVHNGKLNVTKYRDGSMYILPVNESGVPSATSFVIEEQDANRLRDFLAPKGKALVTVRGGVAEVVDTSGSVDVVIFDFDNWEVANSEERLDMIQGLTLNEMDYLDILGEVRDIVFKQWRESQ